MLLAGPGRFLCATALRTCPNARSARVLYTSQVTDVLESTQAEPELPSSVMETIQKTIGKIGPTKQGEPATQLKPQHVQKLRKRFDKVGALMNITNLSGWYRARFKNAPQLRALVGRKAYLYPMLKLAYPEHDWLPWRFDPVPSGFWTELTNQRACLEWALRQIRGDDLQNKKLGLEQWYSVTMQDLVKLDGVSNFIAQYYQGSLFEALRTLYPDHQFLEWKMSTAPHHFWTSRDNRRRFFLWLSGNVLQLDPWSPESYYGIKAQDIIKHGGEAMLVTHFSNSASAAIMDAFPEFRWQPWRFSNVNLEWWSDSRNHRRFMFEWALPRLLASKNPASDDKEAAEASATTELTPTEALKKALEAEAPAKFDLTLESDLRKKLMNLLYTITPQDLIEQGGRMILAKYKTIGSMATFVFPDHKWDLRKFHPSQRPAATAAETTDNVASQVLKVKFKDDLDASNAARSKRARSAAELRSKLDEIGREIGINSLQDWYTAKGTSSSAKALRSLSNLYKSPLPLLLEAAYPEHTWHHWLFARQTFKFWQLKQHHRQFLDWTLRQIKPDAAAAGDLSAWYQIRRRQVIALGGKILLQNYYSSNLPAALRAVYPEHRWEDLKFIKDVLKKSKTTNKSKSAKTQLSI